MNFRKTVRRLFITSNWNSPHQLVIEMQLPGSPQWQQERRYRCSPHPDVHPRQSHATDVSQGTDPLKGHAFIWSWVQLPLPPEYTHKDSPLTLLPCRNRQWLRGGGRVERGGFQGGKGMCLSSSCCLFSRCNGRVKSSGISPGDWWTPLTGITVPTLEAGDKSTKHLGLYY